MDEDQRENLRRERRRLQEQLRRVRRQDRLQQRNANQPMTTTADHHSPSSRSSNHSPIRHLHLQLNNPDLSVTKLPLDFDSSMKNDEMLFDESQRDLLMDTSHHINSASQLLSTSMENLNSNSQTGFGHYFSSTSFGEDGQEHPEMISPTTQANGTDSSAKRKKKSEKDLKPVEREKFRCTEIFGFF